MKNGECRVFRLLGKIMQTIDIGIVNPKESFLELVDKISNAIFCDIRGKYGDLTSLNAKCLTNSESISSWLDSMPNMEQTPFFASYLTNNNKFTDSDYSFLNDEIMNSGIILPSGQLLIRGGSDIAEGFTLKPVSFTVDMAVAIWHARNIRKHQLNGEPMFFHVAIVSENFKKKACINFGEGKLGHEREVLLQRDSKFELIEVSENGYSPCVKLWEIT